MWLTLKRRVKEFLKRILPVGVRRWLRGVQATLTSSRAKRPSFFTVVDADHVTSRLPEATNSPQLPDFSVAVILHAYYVDTIAEIRSRLRFMPLDYDLFVAAPDEEGAAKIRCALASLPNVRKLEVKIAPNRGRNFSTLFVTFREEVRGSDVVLHLHTKKSVYTGTEQLGWRQYLYDGLVGSRELIVSTLLVLERYPKVGLVYPATYPGMPYWAHHTLSNEQSIARALTRAGISAPKAGYLTYPVGGMFWVRTDSIANLLGVPWTYNDFDEEAGQNDGTLGHGLERALSVAAQSRGYSFAEFTPADFTFRVDHSDRNLGQYASFSLRSYEEPLRDFDLISFDIFDTLASRPSWSPDAVMSLVSEKIGLPDFLARRKSAEARARLIETRGDVGLDEIYSQFEPKDLALHARNIEVETDIASLRPRRDVVQLALRAKARGKRLIAISDTYYGRKEIDRILAKCGLDGVFDETYLSSEIGRRKDRGDLWNYVSDREGVKHERWYHVGDNEHSDVQRATDIGVRVFHVMNQTALMQNFGVNVPVDTSVPTRNSELLIGVAGDRLFNSPFIAASPPRPLSLTSPESLGYVVFGALITAFASWVATSARDQGVGRLLFLSREGYLLQKVYDRLLESGLSGPPSSYFEVSRQVTVGAAFGKSFDPNLLLASTIFSGPISRLVRYRTGFILPNGDDFEIDLESPQSRERVLRFVESRRSFFEDRGAEALKALRSYADQHGLDTNHHPGVVDVGYSATIQRLLQSTLEMSICGFYMSTFQQAKAVEPAGRASAYCVENTFGFDPSVPMLRYSQLLEAVLTAPHNQVIGYELTPRGSVRAVHKDAPRLKEADAHLFQVHSGILEFVDDFLTEYGIEALKVAPNPVVVQEMLRLLGGGQIEAPAVLADSLTLENDFGGTAPFAPFRRAS